MSDTTCPRLEAWPQAAFIAGDILVARRHEPLPGGIMRGALFNFLDDAGRNDQLLGEIAEEVDLPNLGKQDKGRGVNHPFTANEPSLRLFPRRSLGAARLQNGPENG